MNQKIVETEVDVCEGLHVQMQLADSRSQPSPSLKIFKMPIFTFVEYSVIFQGIGLLTAYLTHPYLFLEFL